MMPSINKNLEVSKTNYSQRYMKQQYVDIHCHCLPAVDDGPATMSEAIALCLALVDDMITTVIATPHQLGRFDGCNEAAQTREAVQASFARPLVS